MKGLAKATFSSVLAAAILMAQPVAAATPEAIESAIDKGLAWLATQQQADGSWLYDASPYVCTDVATTALIVVKFEERAKELGLDPFDAGEYEYASNVVKGLDYIFANAVSTADGVTFVCSETYSTGTALMAVSASNAPARVITTGPLAGSDYVTAATGMVQWLSHAQKAAGVGSDCDTGGWDYADIARDWADQSNSGYATLGLGFAAAPAPNGFGLTIPADVLTRLDQYVDSAQDPVDGDDYDGGSWYEPCVSFKWVNILKTGNLLYEMRLVGDDPDASQRVQDAIAYIARHWNATGPQPEFPATALGWQDAYQAMFTMMKGLESFSVQTLSVEGSDVDWFDEVSTLIVANQAADGSMQALTTPPYGEGEVSANLRTAWALLTLERIAGITLDVPLDIHPMSCPNPINYGSAGVTPVAILGTADLDVTTIDLQTIRLQETVAPLRWAYEDVSTPYEPFVRKEGRYACNTLGGDGYMDLTLKFQTSDLVKAFGDVKDGDVLVVKLTGNLKEEFGAVPIYGEDVVVILRKGKK